MTKIVKLKKSVVLMLVCTLVLGMLAACSAGTKEAGETPTTPPTDGTTTPKEPTEPAEEVALGKFDPPVNISTMTCKSNTQFKDPAETWEDNWHTDWALEELGINFDYDWVSNGDACESKIRLTMASNSELPDVFMAADPLVLGDLIDSGKLMDVTEAFNKYASDQVKEIYADPSLWTSVTKDGKRYGIPVLSEAYNNDPVLWMRSDWVQKTGLAAPENFADLEKIMQAMLDNDYDGNGKKDYPLTLSMKNNWATWMADSSWIFGGYGSVPGYWNTWGGEELVYGSVRPETKEALALLQDWFKKGYISPDIGLNDEGKAAEQFNANQAGIIAGPKWMAGWPIKSILKKNFPDAEVQPYKIPSGPSGKAMRLGTSIAGSGGLVVSKDFKHMDALMHYLNELYRVGNPEEGSPYEYGMKEGFDYVMKDGKPSYNVNDFPDKKKFTFTKYGLTEQPMVDPMAKLNAILKFYNGEQPSTPYERQIYNVASEEAKANPEQDLEWKATSLVLEQKDISVVNMFKGAPTPTMVEKGEALQKLEQETFLRIIYGNAPVSEFDNFVTKWNEMGGAELTKEVNEWYKSAQ